MAWLETVLTRLAATSHWTYLPIGPRAAEPAALAALALVAHGRVTAAHAPLDWLIGQQSSDGAVGAVQNDLNPAWTTAWAVLAWQVADAALPGGARRRANDRRAIERGVDWLLKTSGKSMPNSADMGHDSTLVGWPWVIGTHSWVEPTALAVLALKASGAQDHPRTLEAQRLLADRLLPKGGCNYGNTSVLGQELRPHVQPTGLCLWALAGAPDSTGRVAKTIDYLDAEIATQSATASLCYALLGLAAHGRRPKVSEDQLAGAAQRTLSRVPSTYRMALLALAAPHPGVSLAPDTSGAKVARAGAAPRTPPAPRPAPLAPASLATPPLDIATIDPAMGASLPLPCDWT